MHPRVVAKHGLDDSGSDVVVNKRHVMRGASYVDSWNVDRADGVVVRTVSVSYAKFRLWIREPLISTIHADAVISVCMQNDNVCRIESDKLR